MPQTHRGAQPRPRRQGADHRRDHQDRRARRESRQGQGPAPGKGPRARRLGRRHHRVPVSALKGQGIDKLLESILLDAEVLELKATFARPPRAAPSSRRRSSRAAARPRRSSCARHAEGRRRLHLRALQRQGEIADRRRRQADEERRPFDAVQGARLLRPAQCRRRIPRDGRASAQPPTLSAGAAERAAPEQARRARAADAGESFRQPRRGPAEGAQHHPQGRRAGLARGAQSLRSSRSRARRSTSRSSTPPSARSAKTTSCSPPPRMRSSSAST